MQKVSIIGMGLSPSDLTESHLELISKADVIAGGPRLLDFFKKSPAEKIPITKDIKGLIELIKNRIPEKSVVVLASGDPLFFGIGERLSMGLGPENVLLYPNISSVAAAFSRIKKSWNDACVISFHGRKSEKQFISALEKNQKIAIFTDPERNPAWIAKFLLEKNITGYKMCVFEQLGTPSEKTGWHSLLDADKLEFFQPNLVVLIYHGQEKKYNKELRPGLHEKWFSHEDGLITKAEIRAVSISKLAMANSHILWDLGAGSGSVSIEASITIKKGHIFAVEKISGRINHIEKNIKQFKVENIDIIHGTLPECMDALPDPDRIFIGGGGEKLPEIIKSALPRLKPGGIIVINTVLISSLNSIFEVFDTWRLKKDIIHLQVSRGREMPWGERLEALNPVWIISGEKV